MRVRRAVQLALLLTLLVGAVFIYAPKGANAECGIYHTVQAGQNLFRISLRYGVRMSAIAAANGIANVNRIFVGQRLYIPCPDTTTNSNIIIVPTGVPYTEQPGQNVSSTQLDCTGFQGTSPDAFIQGSSVFFWDPPRYLQVARYQVRIFNEIGANVGSFETLAPNTTLVGDTSITGIGEGVNFYWYVLGVTADNRICRTPTRYAQREWPKDDPPVGL